MTAQKPYRLLNNSRLYVLATSVLLSVAVVAWQRLMTSSDQLFYIRSEQIFGLLCILYWYAALVISPIGHIIGKQRMKVMEFARRAIGVSAAYFAVLHMLVAFWGQLGGVSGISLLPAFFKWSLLGGVIAVGVLLVMAATSFDAVVRFMTFTRWKWLHRLGYIGGILAVLHVWSVGTHLSYIGVQVAAFVALAIVSGLETYRVVTLFARRFKEFQHGDYFMVLFLSLWAVWLVLILALPSLVQNYHGKHHQGSTPSSQHEGHS